MVTGELIGEGIRLLASYAIQDIIGEQCKKWIMYACIIQLAQIYTNSDFPLRLLFLNHHRTHLVRLFNQFDDTCGEHFINFFPNLLLILRVQSIRLLLYRVHI